MINLFRARHDVHSSWLSDTEEALAPSQKAGSKGREEENLSFVCGQVNKSHNRIALSVANYQRDARLIGGPIG